MEYYENDKCVKCITQLMTALILLLYFI